jgi:hypothetical protein
MSTPGFGAPFVGASARAAGGGVTSSFPLGGASASSAGGGGGGGGADKAGGGGGGATTTAVPPSGGGGGGDITFEGGGGGTAPGRSDGGGGGAPGGRLGVGPGADNPSSVFCRVIEGGGTREPGGGGTLGIEPGGAGRDFLAASPSKMSRSELALSLICVSFYCNPGRAGAQPIVLKSTDVFAAYVGSHPRAGRPALAENRRLRRISTRQDTLSFQGWRAACG